MVATAHRHLRVRRRTAREQEGRQRAWRGGKEAAGSFEESCWLDGGGDAMEVKIETDYQDAGAEK
ncbi:hypothetical protein O9K51_03123 [Purpureocillium lavendulum]|uniref:Uncharacterized protein n=1 Tax=Purpureocillium lavendulum TaxID=1247861 RepID=A0AB34G016_9HYPO|nr:hypothetical protein O9K51_03123 [Purpureocillium lavendulum]